MKYKHLVWTCRGILATLILGGYVAMWIASPLAGAVVLGCILFTGIIIVAVDS